MNEPTGLLNPDDFEGRGEPEGRGRSGGGGGSERRKKKEKKTFLSDDARDRVANELQSNRKKNTQEFIEKHPEVSEKENPSIEATVARLLKLDDDVVGLPRLATYAQWIRRLMIDDDYRETRKIDAESQTVLFKRSKGAGGQNVNKVETAVRLKHRPTGLSFERYEKRSQEANRNDVLEAAKIVVDQHIDKWMEIITEDEHPIEMAIRETLQSVVDKLTGDGKVVLSEAKKSALDTIKGRLLRSRG